MRATTAARSARSARSAWSAVVVVALAATGLRGMDLGLLAINLAAIAFFTAIRHRVVGTINPPHPVYDIFDDLVEATAEPKCALMFFLSRATLVLMSATLGTPSRAAARRSVAGTGRRRSTPCDNGLPS